MTQFPTNLPPGGNLNRDSIGTELNRLLHQSNAVPGNHSNQLFTVHSAGKWMEQSNAKPIPKMLFGQFWYEGELCILFADSNLGKSILAVQIGNSISRNEPVKPFKLEAWPQQILYFDFELADKQFEARYSVDFASHYRFSGGFLRAELDPSADIPPGFINFDAFLHHQLEELIINSDSKILIIDNLTYLRSETERAKDALPLMKHLKSLKTK